MATITSGLSRGFPSPTATYGLDIYAWNFQSFATPAITVPFPSAYAQTQIPFVYPSSATFAATRVPTTIGGVAATAGISTALYVNGQGTTYGLTGSDTHTGGGGGSVWPTWATGVIAGCGGAAVIVVLAGIWCLCRRKRRRARAAGLVANKGYGAEKSNGLTVAPAKKTKRKKGRGDQDPLTKEKELHNGHPADTNAFYASAATQKVPSSRLAKPAVKATRRDPYPPSNGNGPMPAVLAAPRRRENSGKGAPIKDAFGRVVDPDYMPPRFSTDSNGEGRGGYATPQSDLEAPGYADSNYGSPARLWNPDESGGTPSSSVSHTPQKFPKGTRLYQDEMAGSLGALDLSGGYQPRGRENSAEVPMLGRSRNSSVPRDAGALADPWRDTRDRALRRPQSDADLGQRYDTPDVELRTHTPSSRGPTPTMNMPGYLRASSPADGHHIQPPQPAHHYREDSSELAYNVDPASGYHELPPNSPTFQETDQLTGHGQRAYSPSPYEDQRRGGGRHSRQSDRRY